MEKQPAPQKSPEKSSAPKGMTKKFAADRSTLARICDMLGLDDSHNVTRILIDIPANGLVVVSTQELIEDIRLDGVVGALIGEEPNYDPEDPRANRAHNTSTQKNRFVTRQQRQTPGIDPDRIAEAKRRMKNQNIRKKGIE
jgi:hypothetical protein